MSGDITHTLFEEEEEPTVRKERECDLDFEEKADLFVSEKGQLFLIDDICEDTTKNLVKKITYLSHKFPKQTITINMDCPGGQVYNGFAIMNAIKSAKKRGVKVIGRVTGLCASMATLVLQECSLRVACRYSRFMIHEVSEFKFLSNEKATEASENSKELNKVNDILLGILARRIKKTKKEIMEKMRKTDVWMSPNEALKFGLIDKVQN